MQLALDPSRSHHVELARALTPVATLAVVGLLLFAWMCDAVGDHDGITAIDRPVSLWLAAHRTVLEGQAGLLLAKATSPAVLVALVGAAAVVLWVRRHRFEAVVLTATVTVAYGVGGLAKLAEHRARPSAPVNLAPEGEASFPSGHVLVVATIGIVAVTLAWKYLSSAARPLGVVGASAATLGMAADRLLVGAHWMTDVVGSVALAVVFGASVMALVAIRRQQ